MKAVVYRKYGSPDVLELAQVEKPTPKDDEVLVKIHATSLNASDWHILRGKPAFLRMATGLFRPKHKIPGADLAGRVEAIGGNVKQFQPGDEVFGDLDMRGGAFAEYACAGEKTFALKPAGMTFEEAAAVPRAALTALQGLRLKGQIQPGQKVLINGASGGVGTFAVQLAKSFGAHVTAVCSTRNLELVSSLGADEVVDYTKEDFTASGRRYDMILAANGYHPLSAYKRALNPGGVYVTTGGTMTQVMAAGVWGPFMSMFGNKKMGSCMHRPNQEDLVSMRELLEAGKVKPVIEKRYKLNEVPDALRYFGESHARGKIVITV